MTRRLLADQQNESIPSSRNGMKCGEVRGQGEFEDYQDIRVMQGRDGTLAMKKKQDR